MRVTTKTGDKGYTELLFNRRVRKNDVRIEACGALDELISFLGLAKASTRKKSVKKLLHSCQVDLFVVCSEIAALPSHLWKLELRVDEARVQRVEEEIVRLEKKGKQKEFCFVIPGENRTSALLDVCRCIARRAERRVLTIRRRLTVPRLVMVYLNRLSDLLYLLARSEEKAHTPFTGGHARKSARRR